MVALTLKEGPYPDQYLIFHLQRIVRVFVHAHQFLNPVKSYTLHHKNGCNSNHFLFETIPAFAGFFILFYMLSSYIGVLELAYSAQPVLCAYQEKALNKQNIVTETACDL